MKKEKIIVTFSIFSSKLNHIEISELLWIQCDSFCRKWKKINDSNYGAINDTNIWIKESELDCYNNNLNEHLNAMKKILICLKGNFSLLEGIECQLSIILYGNQYNKWVNLDPKMISYLWYLKSSIDIDIYYLD